MGLFSKSKKDKESKQSFTINLIQNKDKIQVNVLDEENDIVEKKELISEEITLLEPAQNKIPDVITTESNIVENKFEDKKAPNHIDEINEIKSMLSEFGLDKLKLAQKELITQNQELEKQILIKQELEKELSQRINEMKEDAVEAFKRSIENFSNRFINKHVNNN